MYTCVYLCVFVYACVDVCIYVCMYVHIQYTHRSRAEVLVAEAATRGLEAVFDALSDAYLDSLQAQGKPGLLSRN